MTNFGESRAPRSGIGICVRCPLCGGVVEKHAVKLAEGAHFFCGHCNNGTWWRITMLSEAPTNTGDVTPLQESPEKKAAWLADAEKRMPVGTRVKVVNSDLDIYFGRTGKVVDYDVGVDGEWPIVSVAFDTPIVDPGAVSIEKDGFICDGEHDDEIVKYDPCECCDNDPCVHADEVPDGYGEP